MWELTARLVLISPLAALVVGLGESLALGGGVAVGFTRAALLAPPALVLALGLGILAWLLPSPLQPRAAWRALGRREDATVTGRVLAAGLVTLAALPVFFRLTLHFLTAYRHAGLAALFLSFAFVALLGLAALLTWRLAGILAALAARPGLPRPVRDPRLALGLVVTLVLGAIVPPLLSGPEAPGWFGFVSLLTKDGLGAGPLVTLAGLAVVLVLGAAVAGRRPLTGRALAALAAGAVVIDLALPFLVAEPLLGGHPARVAMLDERGGLASLTGRAGRRLFDGDRDGHGRWLGGGDCNDRDPLVHPGARERPDNGIDEDCSGADLRLDALRREAAAPPTVESAVAMKRPSVPVDVNVVLITVDTFRFDAAGFMGAKRRTTPRLDELAARGTIYDRAYALGTYTAQSIPPLMTGRYASELVRNDRHETRFARENTFLAELVCGPRLVCAAVLSHFLFSPYFGWNQGFGTWIETGAEPVGPGHISTKYNSHLVTAEAIKWLQDPARGPGRFFLWLHYMDPHTDYLTHEGFPTFGDSRRDQYDHELLFTDHHLGRFLDFFFTRPESKNTIIIVTGDHGEAFGEHGRITHGKELWEEIVRVPLVVVGPGVATKRVTRPTSQIDLFPTFLDLFGVTAPEPTHGRSLLPDWVTGQELPARPVIVDQPENPHYPERRAYIDQGYKLVHDVSSGSYRLHRLDTPIERGDSLETAEPAVFSRLKAAYELFLATRFASRQPEKVTPEPTATVTDAGVDGQ